MPSPSLLNLPLKLIVDSHESPCKDDYIKLAVSRDKNTTFHSIIVRVFGPRPYFIYFQVIEK